MQTVAKDRLDAAITTPVNLIVGAYALAHHGGRAKDRGDWGRAVVPHPPDRT